MKLLFYLFPFTVCLLFVQCDFETLFEQLNVDSSNNKGKSLRKTNIINEYLIDKTNKETKNDNLPKNVKPQIIFYNNDKNILPKKVQKTAQKHIKEEINNVTDKHKADISKDTERTLKNIPRASVRAAYEDLIWNPPPNLQNPQFLIDPVLNALRRMNSRKNSYYTSSSSSSEDLENWKEQWKERFLNQKIEAYKMNISKIGDAVDIAAARPWGRQCGDPGQFDMPTGTCVLPVECPPELRIFRGDYRCGRTSFVCCSLLSNTYDTNVAFELSFEDTDIQSTSSDKSHSSESSGEARRRKKRRERRRRRRERQKRKRKLRKDIDKIVSEIRKTLNKIARNGTSERKQKTRQLKRFVRHLKRQYKKDRWAVREIHDLEIIKIDTALKKKIWEINTLNKNFVKNATFKDIIQNGTHISRKGARMLVEAYPELSTFIEGTRRRYNRRSGRGRSIKHQKTDKSSTSAKPSPNYLDYDVEYGLVYY